MASRQPTNASAWRSRRAVLADAAPYFCRPYFCPFLPLVTLLFVVVESVDGSDWSLRPGSTESTSGGTYFGARSRTSRGVGIAPRRGDWRGGFFRFMVLLR